MGRRGLQPYRVAVTISFATIGFIRSRSRRAGRLMVLWRFSSRLDVRVVTLSPRGMFTPLRSGEFPPVRGSGLRHVASRVSSARARSTSATVSNT